MAEIWEVFLRSILRKKFSEFGWTVMSPAIVVYENTFWKRKIIPDIVMEKGNDVVVFDAKWKKMDGGNSDVEHSDLDRSDFFQIHSYISYYKAQGKNVVLAGLLYPLGKDFPVDTVKTQDNLWSVDSRTKFIVDGIQFKDQEDEPEENIIDNEKYAAYKDEMKKAVDKFMGRLENLLESSDGNGST